MDSAQQHLDLKLDDEPITCRSVWISDIHLGTRHARVGELLDFLRMVDCKYLYLCHQFLVPVTQDFVLKEVMDCSSTY